jgi:hypothetical protein
VETPEHAGQHQLAHRFTRGVKVEGGRCWDSRGGHQLRDCDSQARLIQRVELVTAKLGVRDRVAVWQDNFGLMGLVEVRISMAICSVGMWLIRAAVLKKFVDHTKSKRR